MVEKNQIEMLRRKIERRYRLKCTIKEMRDTIREVDRVWKEWDRARRERRESMPLAIREDKKTGVEEPIQGLDRNRTGGGNRGENVGERSELKFKLINIQGLSEVKLRWLEDKFFGDIKKESMKHVILCMTETQLKMRRFRERPDLISYYQMREGGIRKVEDCK